MVVKPLFGKLSVYVQERHRSARVRERLIALGEKRARSIDFLVVEEIPEYPERENAE